MSDDERRAKARERMRKLSEKRRAERVAQGKPPTEGHPKKRRRDGSTDVHITSETAAIVYDGADLSTWDDSELLAGHRRDKNGRLARRPPRLVPTRLLAEYNRRRMDHAVRLLGESTVEAAKCLSEIIKDNQTATPAERLKAVEILLRHVLGTRVAVDLGATGAQTSRFMDMVSSAIVGSDEQAARVLNGEQNVQGEGDTEIAVGEVVQDEPVPKPARARAKVRQVGTTRKRS
jgi:hypothetical protein